ncbi:MAG TPA: hypothetical protein VEF06_02285 [Bryobacteraceae bacterium]|nr:hypothetical protein [Bryobacteraceae bacterium]
MSVAGIMASNAYQQDFAPITAPVAAGDSGMAAQVPGGRSGPSPGSQFIGLPLPAPIRTDLDDLSAALQKGDMQAAQTAFSNLMSDLSAQYQSQSESSISLLG